MNPLLSDIVTFYKDCYLADNRETNILDVFLSKYTFTQFLEEDVLLKLLNSGSVPLRSGNGEELLKAVLTYEREKELLLGSHLIVGKIPGGGLSRSRNRTICAPLVLQNVSIERTKDQFFLERKPDSLNLNTSVLTQWIQDSAALIDLESLIEEFTADLTLLQRNQKINEWLQKSVGDVSIRIEEGEPNADQLLELKKKSKLNHFTLLPKGFVSLVPRSTSSRGIVHDLDILASQKKFSKPLEQMFGRKYSRSKRVKHPRFDSIPGILSTAPRWRELAARANIQSHHSLTRETSK